MSSGDELRRLLRIMRALERWVSPDELAASLGCTRRTINRILLGLQETLELDRKKEGRRVYYRLRSR